MEAILGLRREGDRLEIDPCLPPDWPGFKVSLRRDDATYDIAVLNLDRVGRGVLHVELDGSIVDGNVIPYVDDGRRHAVRVTLGKQSG
jgi:cellobiose phosphorylase